MQKCLYFICPSDCLESVINKTSTDQNYFYTSLGNSVVFNENTSYQIYRLIQKHQINEICFVLSNANKIVLDALEGQFFYHIRGLKKFHRTIDKKKENLKLLLQNKDQEHAIFSYFINHKIKELQGVLYDFSLEQIPIRGKIFNSKNQKFNSIYSDLIGLENHILN